VVGWTVWLQRVVFVAGKCRVVECGVDEMVGSEPRLARDERHEGYTNRHGQIVGTVGR
jgi:hypothetical protein